MTALCPLVGCGRPSNDGGVCQQDVWFLRQDLTSLPTLLDDLHTTLARQGRSGPVTEKVQGKGETPLAFHREASDALTALTARLVAWARTTGQPWCCYASTAAAHLLEHIGDLRTRGDAAGLWDDLGSVFARARRAVDAPAMRTVIPVGPCPEPECTGLVRAFIPAEDGKPAHMACDGEAPHSWSSIQWLRAGKRIRDLAERRARAARTRLAVFGEQAG